MKLEFIIEGPPVSQQTRRRARLRLWVESVRGCARKEWPSDEPPSMGAVSVQITYFYNEISMDLDNLAKPILDGLKGLAYVDDEQVVDVIIRKRNLSGRFRIDDPSGQLAIGLDRRDQEFLHVLVEEVAH